MASSPTSGRAIAFVDGQNLFYAAKEAFGHSYPKYDPRKLADLVCSTKGWTLVETRFYTGIPDVKDDPFWHGFWMRKLGIMGKRPDVRIETRKIKYRQRTFTDAATGSRCLSTPVGHEKGIDVRIALDMVSRTLSGAMEVALIFSQDQDLAEAVKEVREIARHITGRPLWVASAYPKSPRSRSAFGINYTENLPIEEAVYNDCCDPGNYATPPPNEPQIST